jgi:hypothetical protein
MRADATGLPSVERRGERGRRPSDRTGASGDAAMTTQSTKSANPARALLGALSLLAVLASAASDAARGDDDVRIAIGVTPEGVSCVLGGAIGGSMVPASKVVPMMSHGQEYTLVDVEGAALTSAAIGTPVPVAPEADCEDQFSQELALAPDELGPLRTAFFGDEETVRPMLAQSRILSAEEIEKLKLDIRVYLDESGYIYAGVEIVQAIEFDANGDGVADTLINAINSKRRTARRGEYALILLKDGDSGQFTPVAEEFTEETTEYPSLLWENTVVSILDLDADGRMEVVVYGTFYYGDGWEVIRIGQPAGEVVLGCGCGG